jgi:hypothetical protein
VAGTCEYGKEPSGSIKCGEFRGQLRKLVSFTRRTLLHRVSTECYWRDSKLRIIFNLLKPTGYGMHRKV